MSYDKRHGYVLLYKDSTWAWDGVVWTQLTEVGPPTKFGVAAYDDAREYVILGAIHSFHGSPPEPEPSRLWTQERKST